MHFGANAGRADAIREFQEEAMPLFALWLRAAFQRHFLTQICNDCGRYFFS
jgi:hypothetical protein